MADFVFIHGGLHGAWCWNPLISELEKRGHRGFAFDLPGHGDDPTPRFTVTFDAYAAAANRFLKSRDFDSLVLVGHSIAGMLLPEVARDNAETVTEVVFLAALVLDQGEAAIDLIPESRRSSYFDMADQSHDRTISVAFADAYARFFTDLPEKEARRYFKLLTPQPFAPYLEPARLSARDIAVRRRYILCSRDRTFPRDLCLSLSTKLGGDLQEIDADHDVMLSRPDELARLLIEGI